MVSLCCPLFWPFLLCFCFALAVHILCAHRATPQATVPMTHTTRRSRATGYSSVSEAYEEGEELALAGSVVVLNSCEELELEGDELETVEIVEGGQGRNR